MEQALPGKREEGLGVAQRKVRLFHLGLIISLATLATGLIFRTYDIAVSPAALEGLRQLGIVFLACEIAVIYFALSHGFSTSAMYKRLDKKAQWASAAFLLLMLPGGILFSPIAPVASMLTLIMVLHTIFAASIAFSLPRFSDLELKQFLLVVFAGLVMFAALIAYAFLWPPSTIDVDQTEWQFAVPGFISVRLFGAFTGALAVLFAVQYLRQDESLRGQGWLLAAILLAAGMTVWSGTRAAVVAFFVTVPVIIVFFRIRPSMMHWLSLAGCIILAAMVAVQLVPYGDPNFVLFNATDAANANAMTGGRLVYWQDLSEKAFSYLWLGAGSAASSWILGDAGPPHVQPHNIVLQFVLSWGILASAAAFYLLWRAIKSVHCIALRQDVAIPFVAVIDFLLVSSLFDGTFYFARHMMLAMVCFGVVFALGRTGEDDNSPTILNKPSRMGLH